MIGNTAINMKHDPDYVDSGIGFSVNNTGHAPVTDVLVTDNFAMGNGSMGVSLTPGGPPTVGKMIVAHNFVEGHTANVGIGIELIGTEIIATGNVLKDNQYQITLQRCRDVLIHGNTMMSSQGSRHIGVFFGPATAADRNETIAIRNNVIKGGTGFQISTTVTTPSHKNITVDGNTFANCEHGLLMQSDGSLISIMHNVIDCDDSSVALGSGIHCCGTCVRVAQNLIRPKVGQPAIAIHAPTKDLELRGNTIEGGAYGIAVGAPVTGMYVAGNQLRSLGSGYWSAKENVVGLVDTGDNSWNFDKAKPSSGVWSAGQRVYNLSPSSNGRIGWLCAKSGTPGVWVEF